MICLAFVEVDGSGENPTSYNFNQSKLRWKYLHELIGLGSTMPAV